jgi:two-component system CheB/CheR fusion protein
MNPTSENGNKSNNGQNGKQSTPEKNSDFLIVGIGASAGGIKALKEFFARVPADSGMAYVVILHLSPEHDSLLAEVLQSSAAIPVTQALDEKVRVEPNNVYVIPPNKSLKMNDGHLALSNITRIEERRAPIDIFFRTLAESRDSRAAAVILSGTGADGSMGMKRIKEKGGVVFVQDPREAEFTDMPRNSMATGLVDYVLPVAEMPARILAYREHIEKVRIPVETKDRTESDEQALRDIFTQLRIRTGHDFSNYKRATVLRRIERRISVNQLQGIRKYADFLREQAAEAFVLLRDLLISVTNFFRDSETFVALEHRIISRLFEGKTSDDTVRVWIAGCATGEESYSLAMLLCEHAESLTGAPKIQIFATDIDENAIAAARKGFYTLNDAADVSPERLRNFFVKENSGYRVRRELRGKILFAAHNIVKDPPFSHLDLVSCRNLLIYLNRSAQKRVMEIFHFALNAGGFMFLGMSESADSAGELFAVTDKEHHIYQSRNVNARVALPIGELILPKANVQATRGTQARQIAEDNALERIAYADLHQRLLEQYAPPSIVVNENYEILHLSERAGKYLEIAGGEPSYNLLNLARPEIRRELRNALFQAVEKRRGFETADLKIQTGSQTQIINLVVRPILREDDGNAARGFLLVLFEEKGLAADGENPAAEKLSFDEPSRQIKAELAQMRAQLRVTVDQYEVQTEELKASNEELQAMNEEMRSAAEELETGKEELHSINEELSTVNQELKIKIEELSQSNNDFQNLISSTDIGTLFLDRNLRIKFFTPQATQLFNLIASDIGRPLSDITSRIVDANLLTEAETVVARLQVVERGVKTDDGHFYLMRVLPYRTSEDRIDGVIVTFLDISARVRHGDELGKLSAEIVRQAQVFNTTLSSINDFAYIFDKEGRFVYSNQPLLDLLGITLEEIIGKNFFDLDYPPKLAERLLSQIQQVFETCETVRDETLFTSPDGEEGFYEYIFNPVIASDGSVESVAGSTRDISARKQPEEALRESEERFRAMFEQANVGIVQTTIDGQLIAPNPGFCKIIGYAEAEAKRLCLRDITHADDYEREEKLTRKLIVGEIPGYSIEKRYIRKDGSVIWGEMSATLMLDAKGEPAYALAVVEDISERKRAEEAVRESEERLRLLVESASDYAIFTITPDNIIDSWNAGAEKVFGYTEREILGKSGAILFTPEDRAAGVPEKEKKTAAETGRAEDERWHIRGDGSRFYASGVMRPLKDGKVEGFVKIARDMTDKIAAEKAVSEKEMLQKLVGAQEDERKRIARDLHDELGQQLTALRLKLETTRKLCEEAEICGKIDEIQLIAKQIDADVDFLAWELRPAALDDLGLIAALENYMREWSRHAGVTAEFHAPKLKKMRLAPEIETNLYRITQEALNNTHKHAKAKSISVMLEKRDDLIVLVVEDDGKGFNPKDKKNRSKGLGLMGMQERAALLKGTFEIESAPKQGTTIFVRVPAVFAKKEKENA